MVKRDSNFNPVGGSRGIRRDGGGTADWESVDREILVKAVASAAKVGGALRFGYSRDGGAYAIGIYGDGEPYTEFVRPSEDIDIILKDIMSMFEDIADGFGPNIDAARDKHKPPQGHKKRE